MKIINRSILTLVVLLAAAVAVAQRGPGGPGPNGGQIALARYLQLSPDQIASWKQIHTETAEAMKPLAENARGLREQLATALDAASPDSVAVGKLAVSLDAVRDQMKALREESQSKRLALLTPEQKTKFEAFEAAAAFLKHNRRPNRGR
jgi:Spy/CpxP family protein refolding chaperone